MIWTSAMRLTSKKVPVEIAMIVAANRWPYIRSQFLLGVGYFGLAAATLSLTRFNGSVATLWLATALLAAHLAAIHPKTWLVPLGVCAVASFAASAICGAGISEAPLFTLVAIGEAAVAAGLLKRFLPDGRYFDSIGRVAQYVLLVGLIMPFASAFGGAVAAEAAFGTPFWHNWVTWFSTHSLGTLTFIPIVMVLKQRDLYRAAFGSKARHALMDFGLVLLTVATGAAVFVQHWYPMLFVPIMPMMLLTVRKGQLGTALGVVAMAIIGTICTAAGLGPMSLIRGSATQQALFLQFYLAFSMILLLPLAADLEQRRKSKLRLHDSEAMYRMMTDRSGDVLFNIAVDGNVQYVSPSITKVGGYIPEAVIGTPALEMMHEEDRVVAAAVHHRALSRPNETFVFEYRALTVTGAHIWFETHTRATVDDAGKVIGVISAARDISKRKLNEMDLTEAANSDPLTGLSNRRVFDEKLQRALHAPRPRAVPACLAIVDIDFFKRVNDTHGHPAGDQVLKKVAAAFQPALRRDDVTARIGGEEFGLILWGLRSKDAGALCERLRQTIAALSVEVGEQRLNVTVSIGLADLEDFETEVSALSGADQALYRAKAEGRNCLRLAA
jgi:diguanylate cyclase (GGDEF)-like protein/PAS domain S-box-containing protein